MNKDAMNKIIEAMKVLKDLERSSGLIEVNIFSTGALMTDDAFNDLVKDLGVKPTCKRLTPDENGKPCYEWSVLVDGVKFYTYEGAGMPLEHSWEAENPPVDK